jgi:hypothetical protein
MIQLLLILACIIQAYGAYKMYVNSPINKPEASFITAGNPDYQTPLDKNKELKTGFCIFFIGLLIQIVLMTIQYILILCK